LPLLGFNLFSQTNLEGKMAVIPSVFNATADVSALTLVRYAQIIRYDENAFFGVNAPDNRERACRKIWTKMERDMLARYLGEAQIMIEKVLRYPLGEKWFEDEQHKNVRRFFTQWSRVRSLGVKAVSNVALSVALIHTSDPATLTPTAVTVTNENELHFFQAGTDVEVYPSVLTLVGGTLNASFPRARLVKEAEQDNPDTGLDYADVSPSGVFIQEVDIKRVYTDVTDVGEFVWPLGKNCVADCGEDTEPACGYIRSSQSGVVTLLPTTDSTCIWYGASEVRLNYCAGKPVDTVDEDAIVHLAHSLMPVTPCDGCDPLMMLWKNDRNIPDAITEARANSLFGVYEGAWRAWNYAQSRRHFRISII
jgi:hypothetical protein